MTGCRYSLILLLFLVVFMAGCGGAGRLRYDSPKEAYDKGMEFYNKGKYARAVLYFQGAFDFGRTHEWADDAQLYLARAYRADKDYILAANEYSRFAQIFRSDPRVPEAEFERAMTFYDRSPRYQLDQTDTEGGINAFNLFINRYPTHESVTIAEQRIKELREKLAHKQFDVAQQYEQRGMFNASALSYEVVFDKFSDTDWADDALFGAIRTYIGYSDQSVETSQNKRLQQALDHYQRLLQLFPDSELLKEAEVLYEQVTTRMQALAGNQQ